MSEFLDDQNLRHIKTGLIDNLITFHLSNNLLHVLFNFIWWNGANINIKNSSLWGSHDTVRHHCVFKKS